MSIKKVGQNQFLVYVTVSGRRIRRKMKELGIECRFHDLRHDFVSQLTMAGVHPRVVMELAGHKSWASYKRYSPLSELESLRAIRDLERRRNASVKEANAHIAPLESSENVEKIEKTLNNKGCPRSSVG